jgi:uncharacterized protein YecT (DUF1311 family)
MNLRRYNSIAAATMLSFSLVAAVANADASWNQFDDCTTKVGAKNRDLQECGAQFVAREGTKLNEVWKKAFDVAGPLTKADLLEEQRAWISYKEKACNFFYNGEQGREGQLLHIFTCRAAVIDQRIKELESYRACLVEGAC